MLWPAMINLKKTFSLIVFLTIIFISITGGVLCEELPSRPVDAEQKNIQTPKTTDEVTPTIQQDKKKSATESLDTIKQGMSEEPVQNVQEQAPNPLQAPPSNAEKLKLAGKIADDIHVKISERIESSAAWFDSFFTNDRSWAEENRSNVRVGYNFLLEDSYGLSNQPSLSGRLVLPKLEKKFHLIFSVDPEEPLTKSRTFTENANNQQIVTDTPQTFISDQRRFTTALQYFFKSTESLNISILSGLRFKGLVPVVFAAPRYLLLIPLDSWNFRFTQEVMYRTDSKWQETTRFDIERSLSSLFFRATAQGQWFEDTPGYFYNFQFILSHRLGHENALSYEWSNSFQTQPSGKLTDSVIRVHYRRNVWHDWIFLEITPQCRFPSDRDHRFTPGVFWGLEALFGHPD